MEQKHKWSSFPSTRSHLVEAAVEYFFDFISFKGDSLEVCFVIVVEERQGFSRICESRGGGAELQVAEERNMYLPLTLLPVFPVMILLQLSGGWQKGSRTLSIIFHCFAYHRESID